MAYLRSAVPAGSPLVADYQASILLAYYLNRDAPPSPVVECKASNEVRYGPYRVVVLGAWSATSAQFISGWKGWRETCGASSSGDAVWVFDGGWGFNLLDDLNYFVPHSTSQAQRFGETMSVFRVALPH